MAKKLTKREYKRMKRARRKNQARKFRSPARGLEKTLQERNREVLERLEEKLAAANS